MTDPLITIEPVEEGLTGERVDERLAAGFFPWGQRWMTCRAWPTEEGARDTVWLRVRLAVRPAPDRWRQLRRQGCTTSWLEQPALDDEHEALYGRFRDALHPDWGEVAADLLLHGGRSALEARTRELAVRDGAGRLVAYRWFLDGREAIAGIASVYDPGVSGLGSIARWLVDDRAARDGRRFTYPGYVVPGARDAMLYKLKPGRTEWLDVRDGAWRRWEEGAPQIDELTLARLLRRLTPLGPVEYNPGWAIPCVDPSSPGLAAPFFVVRDRRGDAMRVVVWSDERARHEEHAVVLRAAAAASDDPEAAEGE